MFILPCDLYKMVQEKNISRIETVVIIFCVIQGAIGPILTFLLEITKGEIIKVGRDYLLDQGY
jgi:hypothetical protein